MTRRRTLVVAIASLGALCACGRVEEPNVAPKPASAPTAPAASKVTRVGWLATGNAAAPPERQVVEDFEIGLKDRGYTIGPNFVVEYRIGSVDRLPQLAAELAAAPVDVIVAAGEAAALAAKRATGTIPIVAIEIRSDPVKAGIVANLGRPEANVTGLATQTEDLWQKRLSVFRQIVPKLSRVAVFWNPAKPSSAACVDEIKAAGAVLGMQVQAQDAGDSGAVTRAMASFAKDRPDALLICWDSTTLALARAIAGGARSHGIPTLAPIREYAEAGSLMTYGINLPAHRRRAAFYVDKVLKGAKSGELPVERSAQFDLVFNLGTAKALGLAIPPGILVLADDLIQ